MSSSQSTEALPSIDTVEGDTLRRFMQLDTDKALKNRKWHCPVDGSKGTHLHRMMEHVEKSHLQGPRESEARRAVWKLMVEREKSAHDKLYQRRAKRAHLKVLEDGAKIKKKPRVEEARVIDDKPPSPMTHYSLESIKDHARLAANTFLGDNTHGRQLQRSKVLVDMLDAFIRIGRVAQEKHIRVSASQLLNFDA